MLVTALVFILTLLLIVVSHEFGHFIMAKKFGVKVLEFGFGLPPRLFGKKIGETLVSLNWLPIGGFVKLLGEDETDKKLLSNERSFASRPVIQRIIIVSAGVVINVILSWILFYIVLFAQDFRIQYPTLEPSAMVAKVEQDLPAYQAGIKEGDMIRSIDGNQITSFSQAVDYIKARPKQKLELVVSDLDGQNERKLVIEPKEITPGEGRIGVGFSPIPFKEYKTLTEKIFSAPSYSWDLTALTFKGLGRLFSDLAERNYGKASEQVAGPVGLAAVTSDIVSGGFGATVFYLWFVGVLSLTIAIFNSLPFPALDGGRVLFMIYELITRKKANPHFERWIHNAGMIFLLMMLLLITFSDIRKLLL